MGMTVPSYDTPQVQEAALPSARQESVVSPGLLTAGADRQIRQGEQLAATGNAVNAVAIKMQHEDDLRAVQTATASYTEAAQNFTLDMKDKRTGAGAAGVVADFDAFHKEQVDKILPTLTSPQQKAAFATTAGRARLAVRHDLGAFQITEGKKATDAAFNADVSNAINLGAASVTEGAAMVARDGLVNKVAAYSAVRNMDEAQTKELQGKVLTDFHKQRVQQLVSDPATQMQAQEYFQRHEQEIDGAQRAEIGGFAKKATATSLGAVTAQAEWDKNGPKGDTDVSRIDKLAASLRATLKDNPVALEVALHTVHQLDADRDKGIRAADEAGHAKVNTMLMNGTPMAQVMRTPEWAAIKDPRKIVLGEESIAAARASRAQSAAGAAYTNELRAQHRVAAAGIDTYLGLLNNPDAVAALTPDQAVNLRNTIGDEAAKHIAGMRVQLTRSADALAAAKVDNTTFNSLSIAAGLDPNKKGLSEDDKDRLVLTRQAVDTRLALAAKTKGRPLTFEEKAVEAKKAFDDTVRIPGFWSINGAGTGKDVPIGSLTADEQGRAIVRLPTGMVKLKDVPPQFAAKAALEYRNAGKELTARELARAWEANKGTWK